MSFSLIRDDWTIPDDEEENHQVSSLEEDETIVNGRIFERHHQEITEGSGGTSDTVQIAELQQQEGGDLLLSPDDVIGWCVVCVDVPMVVPFLFNLFLLAVLVGRNLENVKRLSSAMEDGQIPSTLCSANSKKHEIFADRTRKHFLDVLAKNKHTRFLTVDVPQVSGVCRFLFLFFLIIFLTKLWKSQMGERH